MNKIIISIAVVAIAFGAGYLYRGKGKPETITVEKTVYKYLKADKVEVKPDGSINATGGVSIDSVEEENSKREIDMRNNLLLFTISPAQRIDYASISYGRDIFGNIGLAIGMDYSWKSGEPQKFRPLASVYYRW